MVIAGCVLLMDKTLHHRVDGVSTQHNSTNDQGFREKIPETTMKMVYKCICVVSWRKSSGETPPIRLNCRSTTTGPTNSANEPLPVVVPVPCFVGFLRNAVPEVFQSGRSQATAPAKRNFHGRISVIKKINHYQLLTSYNQL